jgi:hypothetical protein
MSEFGARAIRDDASSVDGSAATACCGGSACGFD